MIRAYSYLRFSSPQQMRGDSHRRQSEFASQLCQENGWQLDDSLTLHDLGVSAYRGRNVKVGALGDFLDAVETGKVVSGSILILENIDRLSRNKVGIALQLFIQILNQGVTIVTADPRRTYTQDSINDIASLIEPIIYMSRAYEESRMKSSRLRAAWGQKKKKAKEANTPHTAMCPAWIELVEGAYRLIPERAATVKVIFRMSMEGLGANRLVRILAADPVKYPSFGRSGGWRTTYVERILGSPAAYGAHQQTALDPETGVKGAEGEPLKGFFPAVVTEEEFYAVRAAIRARHGKTGRPAQGELNLFVGLVFEAVEKKAMSMRSVSIASKRKLKKHRYSYLTSGVRSGETIGGEGKFSRSVEYGAFEGAVLACVLELKPSDLQAVAGHEDAREEQIRRLTEDIAGHEHKQKIYLERVADNKTPASAVPSYLKLMEEAIQAKGEAVTALETLKAEASADRPEALTDAQTLAELLRDTTEREANENLRRRLRSRLRLLIEDIWVVVEKTGYNRRVAHVQIYFRGGHTERASFPSPKLKQGQEMTGSLLDIYGRDLRTFSL